jgi:hypothetical protein
MHYVTQVAQLYPPTLLHNKRSPAPLSGYALVIQPDFSHPVAYINELEVPNTQHTYSYMNVFRVEIMNKYLDLQLNYVHIHGN